MWFSIKLDSKFWTVFGNHRSHILRSKGVEDHQLCWQTFISHPKVSWNKKIKNYNVEEQLKFCIKQERGNNLFPQNSNWTFGDCCWKTIEQYTLVNIPTFLRHLVIRFIFFSCSFSPKMVHFLIFNISYGFLYLHINEFCFYSYLTQCSNSVGIGVILQSYMNYLCVGPHPLLWLHLSRMSRCHFGNFRYTARHARQTVSSQTAALGSHWFSHVEAGRGLLD